MLFHETQRSAHFGAIWHVSNLMCSMLLNRNKSRGCRRHDYWVL